MNGRSWQQRFADFLVTIALVGFLFLIIFPKAIFAASPEVAGWIPWWAEEEGTESAERNLDKIDIIYPFSYEVNSDGTLRARSDFDDTHWEDLIEEAEDEDVLIIPSVMWFNGEAIHAHLSSTKYRNKHIDSIVEMVEDGDFDGVNIDYESKWGETIDYFSQFLEDLKEELEDEVGKDTKLTCTVEARMPPEHRWRNVPDEINYANDYEEMNKHCDWVELMAYDQQRADWIINEERRGEPYIPVADVEWVETVVDLALEDFDKDKVMLGVPTYGREWELLVAPEQFVSYDNLQALNRPEAIKIAKANDATISRNAAGELSFTYFPDDSPFKGLEALPVPEGTLRGHKAAAQALMFANATGMEVPVNIVWYSDDDAVEDKWNLVKKYDLKGMAIFKIDGEEDKKIWDIF